MMSLSTFSFYVVDSISLLPLCLVITFIMVSSIFAMTCVETLYTKNLPKEVRGTMNGLQAFFATVGGLGFTKVGGYLHDIHGPKSPFLFAAFISLTFAVVVSIIVIMGKFKY